MSPLAYFSILLLIPLVPAILLYKILPGGDAHVAGTLQGMTIKLSGAFAGYFALVMLGYFRIPAPAAPPLSTYQLWSVSGAVTGADPNTTAYERDLQLRVNPFGIRNYDGRFTVEVLRKEEDVQVGRWVFPTLNVECPGYYPKSINLNDPGKVEHDEKHREIRIRNDLVLNAKAKPSPSPSSTP